MIGLVAIAFVAGSIMTGTMASAQKGGVGDNLIVDALNSIATAITGIDPNVTVDPTPVTVNVDPTPITINAPQGEKGDKGDPGTLSETAVFNVQGIRFVNAPADTVLLSQSFDLTVPSSVLVQVDAIGLNRGAADQLFWYDLEVNGNQVAETLQSAAGFQEWNQAGLNWAGELGVGSHTIEVKLVVGYTGNICSGKDCNLSILVVG